MDSSFYDSSQHHHQSFQSSNEDENKLQDDEAEPEDLTKGTLLKYEPTMVEIQEHEYHPPKPYYVVSIGAHFHHQELKASSLVASNPDRHHGRASQNHHGRHRSHLGESQGMGESGMTEKKMKELVKVLDHYLPPKDLKLPDGKCFRQHISTAASSISDLVVMTAEFERRIVDRHARDVGYCPIRREIFSDLFNEILRQVIVDDPVTGIVLGKVRDELRITMACYRRLNLSMDAYSSRQALQAEKAGTELGRYVGVREDDQNDLCKELKALRKQHDALLFEINKKEERLEKEREADVKRRADDVEFFKSIAGQLNQQMERVRSNAKKFFF